METPSTPFLDEVRKEREAMEKTSAELKQLKADLTELQSRMIMGGGSNAGQATPAPKPQMTPQEYAKSAEKGIIPV